jgi:sterol desaturase/sphingolipid hydroxylase (fatty acid hydroxylase superfamily)
MLPLVLGTAVFLVLMAGIFVPLEGWFARRPGPQSFRAIAIGSSLLFVDVLLLEAVAGPVLDTIAGFRGRAAAPGVARLLAVFLLAELAGYWAHRLMHEVPWLWRFHRLHHEPQTVRWIDAWRQHPVDFVIHGIVVGLPGALLGASLSEVTLLVLMRKTYTTFLHANVDWRLAWLERCVVTPEYHQLHHRHDPRDHGRNFAGMFPLLDRVFGTDRPRI